ncbi:MAG: hypothetical protein OQK66_00980, partial [Prosthecochloris sp.]|uniref:hypothetical protein n=1 Tax=Prosthecochloris sp. TaxID=290513 RepID=UPI00258EF583
IITTGEGNSSSPDSVAYPVRDRHSLYCYILLFDEVACFRRSGFFFPFDVPVVTERYFVWKYSATSLSQ